MNPAQKGVLLVEDEPNDVELIMLAIGKCGITAPVRVVRDGAEALDALAKGELPSVLVLDLQLPRISGLEVLRRLRAEPRTRNLPVVILTSSGQEEDVDEAYRLGANSFVRKPVAFEQYSDAVCRLVLYWQQLNVSPGSALEPGKESRG